MKRTPFSLIFAASILSTALVPVIALSYSYTKLTFIESSAGFLILLAVDLFLWLNYRQSNYLRNFASLQSATSVGIFLGVLWLIEISINNFVAPPLPLRDFIDNLFWAAVAFSILVFAVLNAYRANNIALAIKVAAWSGFVSGLLTCCAGLSIIVFAMPSILLDPLNIAEWAVRQAGSDAPTMAAYFAYETFTGAFLHLVVLGFFMGAILGLLGGVIGKSARQARLLFPAA